MLLNNFIYSILRLSKDEFMPFNGVASVYVSASSPFAFHGASLATMSKFEKHALADIIKEGSSNQRYKEAIDKIFESDKSWQAVFFNDPVVQEKLLEGVMTGDVTDERILHQLENCIPDISFEQQDRIWDDKFSSFESIINRYPEAMIACRFFNSPKRQQFFAEYIQQGNFWDSESNVMLALVNQFAIFTDPKAQRFIARALRDKCFADESDILIAVIGKFEIFTDHEAQLIVAKAIGAGCFGDNKMVLMALIGQLALFTDPEVQRVLASVIPNCFGNDVAMLTTLIRQFKIFTDLNAQLILVDAMNEKRFSNNEVLRTALTKQFGIAYLPPK